MFGILLNGGKLGLQICPEKSPLATSSLTFEEKYEILLPDVEVLKQCLTKGFPPPPASSCGLLQQWILDPVSFPFCVLPLGHDFCYGLTFYKQPALQPRPGKPACIVSYHIISYYIILYHIVSYRIILYLIVTNRISFLSLPISCSLQKKNLRNDVWTTTRSIYQVFF